MSSGRPKPSHHRFQSAFSQGKGHFQSSLLSTMVIDDYDLVMGIKKTRDYLLQLQTESGSWETLHETDISLATEYLLLLAFLEEKESPKTPKVVQHILGDQSSEGGWNRFPGGPTDVSLSVQAYLALKLAGQDADSPPMKQAREAILAAGGIEAVEPSTRLWLALFGIISYEHSPSIPPELMLLPNWLPFSFHQMTEQSRIKFASLSLIWSTKPQRKLTASENIEELFRNSQTRQFEQPDKSSSSASETESSRWNRLWQRWEPAFRKLDQWNLRLFKNWAQQKAAEQIRADSQTETPPGSNFSNLIWNLVALKGLGEKSDSSLCLTLRDRLEQHILEEGESLHFQQADFTVRNTSLATLALREAHVSPDHNSIQKSVQFLLSQENRIPATNSKESNQVEPSGWANGPKAENVILDNEVSCLVLMALCRSLPDNNLGQWTADLLLDDWSPHESDKEVSAIVSTNALNAIHATLQIERLTPILNGLRRGCRWILARQRKEGGWNQNAPESPRQFNPLMAFESPSSTIQIDQVDLTARILEMFATLNISRDHAALKRAVQNVWVRQERDFTWAGSTGINYLHATSQSLVGLTSINLPKHDARLIKATEWLKQVQQTSGGWGETPASLETPSLKACGNPTSTQTAWAILGLLAAGQVDSPEVRRGIAWLLNTQNEDGTWSDSEFTSVSDRAGKYANQQMDQLSYPLIALARYRFLREKSENQ